MATEKAPTRDEVMEELSKKGINNLVELLDALMPNETETGGYQQQSEENVPGIELELGRKDRSFVLRLEDRAANG